MSKEIPIFLTPPFSEEPTGKNLIHFANDLAQLPDHRFPLPLPKCAILLCYDNPNQGVKSMKKWAEAGILNFQDIKALGREEIIVAKLTQINFHQSPGPYAAVYKLLRNQLAGSNLENLIGLLKPEYANTQGNAKLLEPVKDEQGHWWVDLQSLFIERRNLIGWTNKAKNTLSCLTIF